MNNLSFCTQGNFETTVLLNHGEQIEATELLFSLSAGRDEIGNPIPGGLSCGVSSTAYLRLPNILQLLPLFPGSIEFHTPSHTIRVENMIGEDPLYYTIWVNGNCVNDRILDLVVNVNADTGALEGYLSLYEDNWFSPDEITQTQLF